MAENMGTDYVESQIFADEDLAPHDGSSFDRVDPGDYELEIIEASREKHSKKGDPMVTVTYRVVANADGSETPMAGRECRGWYVEAGSEFGRRRFKNFIIATGCVDKNGNYSPSQLIGAHILAAVEHRTRTVADASNPGAEKETIMQNVLKERAIEPPAAPLNAKGKKAPAAQQARR